MTGDAKALKWSLKNFGLSESVIAAAWPDWWTDTAESSSSARAELRFSLARKLGLDPRSLLEDSPRFVWRDEAKFKHLRGEEDFVRAALSSFGISVARHLLAGTSPGQSLLGRSAPELRKAILTRQPYVTLFDLLALCWSFGIPVVHLTLFPLPAKHMCAMTVRFGEQYAILMGQESKYPAVSSFHLAHEIAHIALGHLTEAAALVDLQDPLEAAEDGDTEESAADGYALELLTGSATPIVTTETRQFTAAQLADVSIESSAELGIEPGTIVLCFGHTTGNWRKAFAALKYVYPDAKQISSEINAIAAKQLDWATIPPDSVSFVRAITTS